MALLTPTLSAVSVWLVLTFGMMLMARKRTSTSPAWMPLIVSSVAACACGAKTAAHSRLAATAAALIFFVSEYFMCFPV